MELPYRIEDNGKKGIIVAQKVMYTGRCILNVSAEHSYRYHIHYDAKSDPDAIIIYLSPKDEKGIITERDLRDYMNKLIDQQSWLDLNEEFGEIRQKIIAEAFSPLKKL